MLWLYQCWRTNNRQLGGQAATPIDENSEEPTVTYRTTLSGSCEPSPYLWPFGWPWKWVGWYTRVEGGPRKPISRCEALPGLDTNWWLRFRLFLGMVSFPFRCSTSMAVLLWHLWFVTFVFALLRSMSWRSKAKILFVMDFKDPLANRLFFNNSSMLVPTSSLYRRRDRNGKVLRLMSVTSYLQVLPPPKDTLESPLALTNWDRMGRLLILMVSPEQSFFEKSTSPLLAEHHVILSSRCTLLHFVVLSLRAMPHTLALLLMNVEDGGRSLDNRSRIDSCIGIALSLPMQIVGSGTFPPTAWDRGKRRLILPIQMLSMTFFVKSNCGFQLPFRNVTPGTPEPGDITMAVGTVEIT